MNLDIIDVSNSNLGMSYNDIHMELKVTLKTHYLKL